MADKHYLTVEEIRAMDISRDTPVTLIHESHHLREDLRDTRKKINETRGYYRDVHESGVELHEAEIGLRSSLDYDTDFGAVNGYDGVLEIIVEPLRIKK